MTSDNVILVAGGDLRQQYAARRLRQKTGADVWTLGLPAQSGLHSAETLEEVPAYDVLVLPVPASPDGTTVPAPFGKAALPLETLAAHGKPGALVLGGACGGILPWLESRGLGGGGLSPPGGTLPGECRAVCGGRHPDRHGRDRPDAARHGSAGDRLRQDRHGACAHGCVAWGWM